jgi:hypothetical protein
MILGVGVLAREAFDRQRSRPVGVFAMLAEDSRPGRSLLVPVPVRIGQVERYARGRRPWRSVVVTVQRA